MRQVYIVNATQVVTTDAHPEGLLYVVSGFPKNFDSQNYDSEEATLHAAKAAYLSQLSTNYANTNPNRVMTTVTLEMANGRQVLRESIGGFPDVETDETEETEETEE